MKLNPKHARRVRLNYFDIQKRLKDLEAANPLNITELENNQGAKGNKVGSYTCFPLGCAGISKKSHRH